MIGAIAGDIIGSPYEARPARTMEFTLLGPGCRFTDDTVLTAATAFSLMTDGDYARELPHLRPAVSAGRIRRRPSATG